MFSLYIFLFTIILVNSRLPNYNKYSRRPFRLKNIEKDLNYKIEYKITEKEQNVLNKIDGFYGMIGPDVNITTIKTLYDLFTGDGIIQGVFFNKGNLTFVKHLVTTEKLNYEEKHGKISKDVITTMIMLVMNKIKLFPNIMGVANTALLEVNKKIYALFERDLPYLVSINFENKTLGMDKKVELDTIEYISGHSKYDYKQDIIHTIEYHMMSQSVNYYQLFENFEIKNKKTIYTKYLPIVHDFAVFNGNVLMTDSPLVIKLMDFNKVPVSLAHEKPTYIHILNTSNSKIETYNSTEGFYVFHYADVFENKGIITIYAPVYERMDFSTLNINGKYRKITINRNTKKVFIEKNKVLENYNLDFPIKYKNQVVLRNIYNNTINGFVICEKLNIKKTIMLKDNYVCGEPSVLEIEKKPYIIAFSYDKDTKGYLTIINMENSNIINIPLNCSLGIGFHSMFLKNS